MVPDYQDQFLNKCRKNDTEIKVYLISGYQMVGTIRGFDNFSLVLKNDDNIKMIYKHAISTIEILDDTNIDLEIE